MYVCWVCVCVSVVSAVCECVCACLGSVCVWCQQKVRVDSVGYEYRVWGNVGWVYVSSEYI